LRVRTSAALTCRSIDLRFVCRFVLGLNTGRITPYCAGASWPGVGRLSGMFRGVGGCLRPAQICLLFSSPRWSASWPTLLVLP